MCIFGCLPPEICSEGLLHARRQVVHFASFVCAGIPKFYRWLSERYPCVNQPISEANVPILDNLYLDMNGIIHNCTHGNDPGTKLTEDQMVAKIYMYLERLMSIVQPQKLLFMAIDGAPPTCTYLMGPTHLRHLVALRACMLRALLA